MIDYALASEVVATATSPLTDYATILVPLTINFLMLAYLSGRLTEKIKALEADIIKTQFEIEKIKDTHGRFEGNLHRIELVLSRIEARFDMFTAVANEAAACPIVMKASKSIARDPSATEL